MEELNRRKAVVYCHPYCAACGAQTELTDAQNRGVEFVFDTTRTILSMLQTGASARFSDIRFIWSHGGGTVPFITSRLAERESEAAERRAGASCRRFYYDTAQAFNPYTMPSFKKFVPGRSHCLRHRLPAWRRLRSSGRERTAGQRRVYRCGAARHRARQRARVVAAISGVGFGPPCDLFRLPRLDGRPVQIVAGTGNLAELPLGPKLVVERRLPRLGQRHRVFHGDVQLEVIAIHAAEPFGHLQLLAVRMAKTVEPRLVVEANRFHDEVIALPSADRVAHPKRVELVGHQFAAVREHAPDRVVVLVHAAA